MSKYSIARTSLGFGSNWHCNAALPLLLLLQIIASCTPSVGVVGYYSYQTILAALGEKLERFSIEKNKNGVVNSIIIVTLLLLNITEYY